MNYGFLPAPFYPEKYDSYYTLLKTFNTSESQIAFDNQALSDEISIIPTDKEIWATNGYANISGELFYYDNVEYNSQDQICKLKNCIREIGGEKSIFNPAGTWVRGYVVAEHHNQLSLSTIKTETFIGENFSPDITTLDWRIRNLADSPLIDDLCPDVNFTYRIISSNPSSGTLIEYSINIIGDASFLLQFGDGSETNSSQNGTYLYAPGAEIDPIVTLTGPNCQIVRSPIIRNNPNDPQTPDREPPFTINIPQCPEIPPIVIPSLIFNPPTINVPQITLPGIDIDGNFPSIIISGNPIPSTIGFGPLSIPSTIGFGPVNIPRTIDFGPIKFPSLIKFGPVKIPSQIKISPVKIPDRIRFDNVPEFPNRITFAPPPPIPPIQIQPITLPPIRSEPIRIQNADQIPRVIRLEGPKGLDRIEKALENLKFPSVIKVEMADSKPISVIISNPKPMSIILDTKSKPISVVLKIPNKKIGLDTSGLKISVMLNNPKKVSFVGNFCCDDNGMSGMMGNNGMGNNGMGMMGNNGMGNNGMGNNGMGMGMGMGMMGGNQSLIADSIDDVNIKFPNLPNDKLLGKITKIRINKNQQKPKIDIHKLKLPNINLNEEDKKENAISYGLNYPNEFPEIRIKIPDELPTINVKFPSEIPRIKLEIDENLKVPLVYTGPPIPIEPVKIQFAFADRKDIDPDLPCVVLVPCKNR